MVCLDRYLTGMRWAQGTKSTLVTWSFTLLHYTGLLTAVSRGGHDYTRVAMLIGAPSTVAVAKVAVVKSPKPSSGSHRSRHQNDDLQRKLGHLRFARLGTLLQLTELWGSPRYSTWPLLDSARITIMTPSLRWN